jgi:hypothetical protein
MSPSETLMSFHFPGVGASSPDLGKTARICGVCELYHTVNLLFPIDLHYRFEVGSRMRRSRTVSEKVGLELQSFL